MVERFNGRISEVIKQTRFASAAELASTLNNYWQAYNHHIPQRALGHVSPIDSLKNWHQKKPELFRKRIYKQAELDIYQTLPEPPYSPDDKASLAQLVYRHIWQQSMCDRFSGERWA